jgi:NitT/TauT family transport system substrate-binding protein
MVNISGTQNILSASMRGDINGGPLSPSDAFLLAQRKIPIKIVTWLGHAHKGTKCGIHVAAQSDIHALSDLKGRRIGVSTSINSKVLLTEAARKGGVAEKDMTILWGGTPDNPMQYEAALRSGGIDGFVV